MKQADIQGTGETTSIVQFDSTNANGEYGEYRWSADGRALLYRHLPRGIVSHEVATGIETVVVDPHSNALTRFWGFAESPDRSSLAFVARTRGSTPQAKVLFVQAAGGQPRELLRVTDPEWVAFVSTSSARPPASALVHFSSACAVSGLRNSPSYGA